MKITTLAPGEQFELPKGERIITQYGNPACIHAEHRFLLAAHGGALKVLDGVELGVLIKVGKEMRAVRTSVAQMLSKGMLFGEPNGIVNDPDSPFHLWIANAQRHLIDGENEQDYVLARPLRHDVPNRSLLLARLARPPFSVERFTSDEFLHQNTFQERLWRRSAIDYRNLIWQERLQAQSEAQDPSDKFVLPDDHNILIQTSTPLCSHAEHQFANALRSNKIRDITNIEIGVLLCQGEEVHAVRTKVARALAKSKIHGEPNAIIMDPSHPLHLWVINARYHPSAGSRPQYFILGRPLYYQNKSTYLRQLLEQKYGTPLAESPVYDRDKVTNNDRLWMTNARAHRDQLWLASPQLTA